MVEDTKKEEPPKLDDAIDTLVKYVGDADPGSAIDPSLGPALERLRRAVAEEGRGTPEIQNFLKYLRANNIPYSLDERPGYALGTTFEPAVDNHFKEINARRIDPRLQPPVSKDFIALNMEGRPLKDGEPTSYHGDITTAYMNKVLRDLSQSNEPVVWVQGHVDSGYDGYMSPEIAALLQNSPNIRLLSSSTSMSVPATMDGANRRIPAAEEAFADKVGEHKIIVFAAGNGGEKVPLGHASYRHNGLPISVAAAVRDENGEFVLTDYSGRVAPAIAGVVMREAHVKWEPSGKADKGGTVVTNDLGGTSSATPYVSGVLQHLIARYGKHLSNEQIVAATLLTATPIAQREVSKEYSIDVKKGEKHRPIEYATTANGHKVNHDFAGFGLANVADAERVLQHMVAEGQLHPERLTTYQRVAERQLDESQIAAINESAKGGAYVYPVTFGPGTAVSMNMDFEFKNPVGMRHVEFAEEKFGTKHEFYPRHGNVKLISPSGTEIPLVLSAPDHFAFGVPSFENNRTAFASTLAMVGEKLEGTWKIVSTEPLSQVEVGTHAVGANDLIRDLNRAKIQEWLAAPVPDVSKAKTREELWKECGLDLGPAPKDVVREFIKELEKPAKDAARLAKALSEAQKTFKKDTGMCNAENNFMRDADLPDECIPLPTPVDSVFKEIATLPKR